MSFLGWVGILFMVGLMIEETLYLWHNLKLKRIKYEIEEKKK